MSKLDIRDLPRKFKNVRLEESERSYVKTRAIVTDGERIKAEISHDDTFDIWNIRVNGALGTSHHYQVYHGIDTAEQLQVEMLLHSVDISIVSDEESE